MNPLTDQMKMHFYGYLNGITSNAIAIGSMGMEFKLELLIIQDGISRSVWMKPKFKTNILKLWM